MSCSISQIPCRHLFVFRPSSIWCTVIFRILNLGGWLICRVRQFISFEFQGLDEEAIRRSQEYSRWNTPVSVIQKQGKNSPDPRCSTESPPDRPNFNQMDAGSAILYWKIDPEYVSSEKKFTGWRREIKTGFSRRRFLCRIDHFRPFFFVPDIFPHWSERMTDTGVV